MKESSVNMFPTATLFRTFHGTWNHRKKTIYELL